MPGGEVPAQAGIREPAQVVLQDGRLLQLGKESDQVARGVRVEAPQDLAAGGIHDPIDLDEVQTIYLPLSRLLNMYVGGGGALP